MVTKSIKTILISMFFVISLTAQSLTDLFSDGTNTLLSSSYPTIVGFANEFYSNNTLSFDLNKNNNYVGFSSFCSTFQPDGINDLTSAQISTLTSAIYSQYTQIVTIQWNNAISNKLNQSPGMAPNPYTPPPCVNYAMGTVWEVFWNATNLSIWNQQVVSPSEPINYNQAVLLGWAAVVTAFPCYGGGNSTGGAFSIEYIPTWEEIWARFAASVVH